MDNIHLEYLSYDLLKSVNNHLSMLEPDLAKKLVDEFQYADGRIEESLEDLRYIEDTLAMEENRTYELESDIDDLNKEISNLESQISDLERQVWELEKGS